MPIVFTVGLILLAVVYIIGAYMCVLTLADIDVPMTPLAAVIVLTPILHWYYVFKYLDGGWHNWVKDLKEAINEYKELD